jgi:hypothetical protein
LPKPLKGQFEKIQAISRHYFPVSAIQYEKESGNCQKTLDFAGVVDTGEASNISNISANNRKKSKTFLGLSTGTRRSRLTKKNGGEKSRDTVPLTYS